MRRFKTNIELTKELGSDWRKKIIGGWDAIEMDLCLGEPFDKTGADLKIPNCRDTWTITDQMLTSEPLLPIGTKVAIPKTKSVGGCLKDSTSVKIAKNKKQDYLYYIGSDSHHKLCNDNLKSGDYFTAKEILDAYEEYQKLKSKPIFKFKEGDEVYLEKYDLTDISDSAIHIRLKDLYLNSKYHITTICDYGTYKNCIALREGYGGLYDPTNFKSWSEHPSQIKSKEDLLLEEAKLRYPKGTQYMAVSFYTPDSIYTSEGNARFVKRGVNGFNKSDINICVSNEGNNYGAVYIDGEWAKIIPEEKPKIVIPDAKAGDWVKIISCTFDLPKLSNGQFSLNKPYQLSKDLTESKFYVIEDDKGNKNNGYSGKESILKFTFEKVDTPKPTFKTDDWVYFEYDSINKGIFKIANISSNLLGAKIGFEHSGRYTENQKTYCDISAVKRLATKEEISKYLLGEAKKRYPIGTKVISAYITKREKVIKSEIFILDNEDIHDGDIFLYYDDKWAEITSKPETKSISSLPDKSFFYDKAIACINSKNFKKIQELLFKLGFTWVGKSTELRDNYYDDKIVLIIDKYGNLMYGDGSITKPNYDISNLLQWIPDLEEESELQQVFNKSLINTQSIQTQKKQTNEKEHSKISISNENSSDFSSINVCRKNSSISIGNNGESISISRKIKSKSIIKLS